MGPLCRKCGKFEASHSFGPPVCYNDSFYFVGVELGIVLYYKKKDLKAKSWYLDLRRRKWEEASEIT
jgi:hypothetical protein